MALTRPRAYQIYDIDYKQSVRVVTITNVILSGGAPNSVDGVNLSLNNRVLVTGQSNAAQNGIYYVTTVGSGSNGTWARSADTNATGELLSGTIVMVTEGSTYADTQWKLITNDPITIGSTALTFVQNYLANLISFGQTSFAIGSSNANATVSVAGISNVAVFTTQGANITGNITGGNIAVSTTLSAWDTSLLGVVETSKGSLIAGPYNDRLTLVSGAILGSGGWSYTGSTAATSYTQYEDGSHVWSVAPAAPTSTAYFTEAMKIDVTGNVGMGGIITPADKLDVFGNVRADIFYSTVTTGTAPLIVNSTTQVANLNAATAGTAGTVTTAAQGNITSVGTLTSLAVAGNVTGGNLITAGQVTATGNITSVGNISGSYILGNGSKLTGISGGAGGIIWTTVANTAPLAPSPGDFWYNSYSGVKYQYTNDGTGNTWVDQSFPTTFTTLTTNQILNGGSNGTGNIGSSTGTFNTIFAKATSAQYADLAEKYIADGEYPPGTVVVFGGPAEITISTHSHDTRVAGVISTNPAFIMNSESIGLLVAFTGRVPCLVKGPVSKGDILVASELPGTAQKLINWQPGCVIGKSLENIEDNSVKTIEVVVGRF
jgi:hypothetical protein